mmetsp:Transcript_3845/g.8286  ORF Transcript_3845/g.8286 Transcript_3845/m.8286 type:complete len:772 (+) Transcript_3845:607-2922(+)|eukprot:CAMPEP_0171570070 /NCGR_PEP_ID=MMETSP0961-20121227/2724_1 /TAXON_ID=87120 /ORGANISM="Aurantiochytrium limacinum, Strain ATCCMYA-1381" /LENGTH=771 /DNA_ID=CAMNT_0012124487 /DNA_START=591 /DNA_END=2906 /DNA_ORIENTATION=+
MEQSLAIGLQHIERLRKLYRAQPRDDNAIERVAKDARTRLEEVILGDPPLAARKEVEDQLWRYCYYKRIEEFRKRLAKSGRPSQASDARETAQRQRALRGDFLHFLDVAQSQYASFLTRLTQAREATSKEDIRKQLFSASIHRCHLYTGDLARYRELNDTSREQKSYEAAAQQYKEALRAYPQKGNPHNQLAVLAQYRNEMIVALFRYEMALLVPEPFETAQTNLNMLYDFVLKNARKRDLLNQPVLPSNAPISGSQRSALLRDFSFRFVLLHGLVNGHSHLKPEDGVSQDALMKRVIDELALLVRKSALNKEVRLALVVTSISLVLNARKTRTDPDVAETLAFSVVSTFASHLADAAKRGPAEATPGEALTAVSVFLEWIREDIKAGNTIDLKRKPAALTLWNSLQVLWPSLLAAANGGASTQTSIVRKPELLWEDVELEAFVPLRGSRGYLAAAAAGDNKKPAASGQDREKAATERGQRVCLVCDWIMHDSRYVGVLPFDASFALPVNANVAAISSVASLLDKSHLAHSAHAGWSGAQRSGRPTSKTQFGANEEEDDGEEIIMLVPGSLRPGASSLSGNSSDQRSTTASQPGPQAMNKNGLRPENLAFTIQGTPSGTENIHTAYEVPPFNSSAAFLGKSNEPPLQPPRQMKTSGFPGTLTAPQTFGLSRNPKDSYQDGPGAGTWQTPMSMNFVSPPTESPAGSAPSTHASGLLSPSALLPFLPPMEGAPQDAAASSAGLSQVSSSRPPPGFASESMSENRKSNSIHPGR